MKVWDSYLPDGMGEFLTERGVDMPRAWSLHCRQANSGHGHPLFRDFLKAEYPVDMVAWRILGGR